ncbi:MAG: ASKHA domain-containing protein [Thermodesulfobacteriota bacterium]
MEHGPWEIKLLGADRRVAARAGQNLLAALAQAGVPIRSDCGGQGKCGKCQVYLISDSGAGSTEEVLACQTAMRANLVVEIPPRSLGYQAEVVAKPRLRRTDWPAPGRAARGHGLALDLGTTTMAVFLCDLAENRVLATAVARNPQAFWGADVMSRITAVSQDQRNLERLQVAAVSAAADLARSLLGPLDLPAEDILEWVVVGNPTMIHLFLGTDPYSLGRSPFQPAFQETQKRLAVELGLPAGPSADLITLPLVSGFVGADIIAAALTHDLDRDSDGLLVMDIGTNGELMLAASGRLWATSCATGPALEGAAISCGLPAVSGAIDRMSLGPNGPSYTTIQRRPDKPVKPRGLCGSGIVSAVAALVKNGVLDPSGRFSRERAGVRLRRNQEGVEEFVLVRSEDTAVGQDITLTQKDVRAVQLAKGALYTGVRLLCRQAGLARPGRVLLAGAFGSHLDIDDLLTIGLLPAETAGLVESVGNAAGEGAVLALMDREYLDRAEAMRRRTQVLELAAHPDFQTTFLDSLAFPCPGL